MMTDIAEPPSKHHFKILVVDDDPLYYKNFDRLLHQQKRYSFDLEGCRDAETALAKMREKAFDCVLLDFNLPDMTGLDFLRNAAANTSPCAFVLITGFGNEAIAVESMKLGAQDYLPKDKINVSSLIRAITQAVTQNELRRHLAASLRDLTAANEALEQEAASRKATEEALLAAKNAAEAANEAKTRFVAMVTHELRTPLNGILGYAQLLRIEGGLSKRQEERVNAMMHTGQHLRSMIESVLDFASIEAGRFTLHPEPVLVNDLIDSCVSLIGPLAVERMLTLNIIKSHDVPREIVADRARLRQVILNLLGNAVKYTPSGRIELRVQRGQSPDGLRVEVADTGPGIDLAYRDRLFTDFERSNALPSTEGAGLGLAIAARLIKLMEGNIGYLPNPTGGSVFWLEVPPPKVPVEPSLNAAPIPPAPPGLQVLLAEDVPMNRDVIGAFLRAAGHIVTMAKDGREAFELASKTDFDLILMDVQMPEMDGLEATRRIRALSGNNSLAPIIALTAQSFKEQIDQCMDAGMNEYVAKPVDYSLLNHAIAKVISSQRGRGNTSSSTPHDKQGEAETTAGFSQSAAFNQAKFNETSALLPPAEVKGYLEWLNSHCRQILTLLKQSANPTELSKAVHTLASTSGMFGFETLCSIGRHYERAILQNSEQAATLAPALEREIFKTMSALGTLVQRLEI